MEVCLFCNEPEEKYKPDKDNEFICGSCVILLADTDQADLKRSYQKALNEGYLRKASALESFIIPEVDDEQIRPNVKSFSNGRGNKKVFRIKERPIRRIKKNQRVAVRQGEQNPKVVL